LKTFIEKWGLHETSSDNGVRATDFVTNNNTIIRRYILATQNIQKDILQSSATRTNNQIAHVLVEGRHASIIVMRSCGAANCESDHHLFSLSID
jgi:hypothetical protein